MTIDNTAILTKARNLFVDRPSEVIRRSDWGNDAAKIRQALSDIHRSSPLAAEEPLFNRWFWFFQATSVDASKFNLVYAVANILYKTDEHLQDHNQLILLSQDQWDILQRGQWSRKARSVFVTNLIMQLRLLEIKRFFQITITTGEETLDKAAIQREIFALNRIIYAIAGTENIHSVDAAKPLFGFVNKQCLLDCLNTIAVMARKYTLSDDIYSEMLKLPTLEDSALVESREWIRLFKQFALEKHHVDQGATPINNAHGTASAHLPAKEHKHGKAQRAGPATGATVHFTPAPDEAQAAPNQPPDDPDLTQAPEQDIIVGQQSEITKLKTKLNNFEQNPVLLLLQSRIFLITMVIVLVAASAITNAIFASDQQELKGLRIYVVVLCCGCVPLIMLGGLASARILFNGPRSKAEAGHEFVIWAFGATAYALLVNVLALGLVRLLDPAYEIDTFIKAVSLITVMLAALIGVLASLVKRTE
jgi:hypothetical protein